MLRHFVEMLTKKGDIIKSNIWEHPKGYLVTCDI
jgi:hypothetical protein